MYQHAQYLTNIRQRQHVFDTGEIKAYPSTSDHLNTLLPSRDVTRRHLLFICYSDGDPIPLDWLVVALGAYDLETDDEPTRQLLDIELAIKHPGFDSATYDNDIGLVKVSEKIRFSPQVSPVCLPTKAVPANTLCVATGWGSGTGAYHTVVRY